MGEQRQCIKCKVFAVEDSENDLIDMNGKLAYTEWQCTNCGCAFLYNRNSVVEFINIHRSEKCTANK